LSAPAPSSHDLSLAAFTINIAESNFRHTHPAGNAKSRTGITPCGLIRDCWFPSSVAVVISGEERKGSGLLRKDSASRSAPAHGSPGLLTRGCQFDNMAKTTTSIVRFRSAMITVLVIIDRLRRHRRIGSIEGVSQLLVRAAGRYGPIPGVRSGRARRCRS